MIELRRFQLENEVTPLSEWLRELKDLRARAQIEVRLRRVSAAILAIANPLVKAFRNYESISEQVIACILESMDNYSSSCCARATKPRSKLTSIERKIIGQIGNGDNYEYNHKSSGVA
jgi:hypothetical protein